MAVLRAFAPAMAMALAACATSAPADSAPAGPAPAEPQYQEREAGADHACDASGLQDHIGHTASAKSGAVLLELSGARVLRWVPPRTAVTMDYRQDRLTVSYDDDMKITRISCG